MIRAAPSCHGRAGPGLGDLASIVKAYDVVPGGLGSAGLLYRAGGGLDTPGAMITASRDPSRYHGIKLRRASAKPIGTEATMVAVRDEVPGAVRGTTDLSE
jgi:hypothetical protein